MQNTSASNSADAKLKPVLQALAEALWPNMPAEGAAAAAKGDSVMADFYNGSGLPATEDYSLVMEIINERLPPAQRSSFKLLLQLLTWRIGTLLLAGPACLTWRFPFVLTFPEMPVEARQVVLRSWALSNIEEFRKAFKGIKSFIAAVLFSVYDSSGMNHIWKAMGYPGPQGVSRSLTVKPESLSAEASLAGALTDLATIPPSSGIDLVKYLASRGLATRSWSDVAASVTAREKSDMARLLQRWWPRPGGMAVSVPDAVVECDVVVVGSGAGGGVTADRLSAAGLRVLVLEKSGWVRMSDMTHQEKDAMASMYENGGFLSTADGAMNLLAGSTLGGATKVNWAAALPPPPNVLKEWSTELGLKAFTSPEYDRALQAVQARLGVGKGVNHNVQNGLLKAGLEKLGANAEEYPRNCHSNLCSGFCNMGCKWGQKQSTDITFLTDAVRRGNTSIITGAYTSAITTTATPPQPSPGGGHSRRKAVTGVLVMTSAPGAQVPTGQGPRIWVRAPLVIACGGSVNTPALLLRSGITCGGNVGKNLRLHPGAILGVQIPSKPGGSVKIWEGGMMTMYSKEVSNWEDGNGYGPLLSVPVGQPGLLAAGFPWRDGASFKKNMLTLADRALFVAIVRDKDSGRVTINEEGRPVLNYWPSEYDRQSMVKGMQMLARAAFAAGATHILGLHNPPMEYPAPGQTMTETGLQEFLDKLAAVGVHKHRMPVFSAHQMASCRMGTSPRSSVVDPEAQCWEVAGLYVADASALPTSSGANPMMSTESMSYMTMDALRAKIVKAKGGDGDSGKPRVHVTPSYE